MIYGSAQHTESVSDDTLDDTEQLPKQYGFPNEMFCSLFLTKLSIWNAI